MCHFFVYDVAFCRSFFVHDVAFRRSSGITFVHRMLVVLRRTTSCGSRVVCVKQGGGDRIAMSNVTVYVRFWPMNAREAQVESGAPCIRRFDNACVLFKVNIAPSLHRLLSC
jgi:hypothetical protein